MLFVLPIQKSLLSLRVLSYKPSSFGLWELICNVGWKMVADVILVMLQTLDRSVICAFGISISRQSCVCFMNRTRVLFQYICLLSWSARFAYGWTDIVNNEVGVLEQADFMHYGSLNVACQNFVVRYFSL